MRIMMEPISDEHLVVAIRQHDECAFKTLYFRYAKAIFRFLRHRTKDTETAEDLVQECFARLWTHREKLDEHKSIKAWCYQVAGNLAVDHLRRKVNQDLPPEWQPETVEKPDETEFQVRDRVRRAVTKLPPAQRQVIELSRFAGLKYNEIAEVMQISVKTVENHMTRALKKLRLNLKDFINQILF